MFGLEIAKALFRNETHSFSGIEGKRGFVAGAAGGSFICGFCAGTHRRFDASASGR
jgi:hypothetical protein